MSNIEDPKNALYNNSAEQAWNAAQKYLRNTGVVPTISDDGIKTYDLGNGVVALTQESETEKSFSISWPGVGIVEAQTVLLVVRRDTETTVNSRLFRSITSHTNSTYVERGILAYPSFGGVLKSANLRRVIKN